MFENPSSGGIYIEDGRYVVKVVRLEEAPPSPNFPEAGPGIKWVFNLQDAQTKEIVKDERGLDGEMWQFSSTKMTPRSKGRKWAEALLARPVAPDELGAVIAALLPGRKALALIGQNESGRSAIMSMTALAPAAAASPAQKAQAQGRAQAGTAVAEPEAPPDEQLDLSDVDAEGF